MTLLVLNNQVQEFIAGFSYLLYDDDLVFNIPFNII